MNSLLAKARAYSPLLLGFSNFTNLLDTNGFFDSEDHILLAGDGNLEEIKVMVEVE